MKERTYPYVAWTLLPSFKLKEVTLVARAYESSYHPEWDRSESGKVYHVERDLMASQADAIAEGWKRLSALESDLVKRQDSIAKRRAALIKAAGTEQL